MTASVHLLPTGDRDAVAIGKLCAKAKGSMVDSVKYLIEAGRKLKEKKDSLAHGEWLPWLKENEDALEFKGERMAQRLMAVANKYDAGVVFEEAKALQISKSVWGHVPKAATKPGNSKERKPPKRHDRTDEVIALTDAGGSRPEVAETTGLSERTVRRIVEAETLRREAETEVDPATLSMSAQKKLEVALRQHRQKLEAEYAARQRDLNEEVRLRVIAENKDYLAMVQEKEAKARADETLWREMMNKHKPLFTADEFRTILMCLHPDGQRTADKLAEAFRLFNAKKVPLTGAR